MLKVFVGKNKIKEAEEIRWESMSSEELTSLSSTPSLFGGAQTFLLVGALGSDRQDEFLKLPGVLTESPHTFIFEEEKLLKAPTVALEKAGAKIEVEKKAASTGKERGFDPFDPFGLTFALAARDKKKLWLALTYALAGGEKPEAIAGLLHWKVRDLLGSGSSTYSPPDLRHMSRELVYLYHDSHRGIGELHLLLEKYILSL